VKLRRRGFTQLAALATLLHSRTTIAAVDHEDLVRALSAAAQHIFPHAGVAPAHYHAIAESFAAASMGQAERLAHELGGGFADSEACEQRDALRTLETTPDFQTFRFHILMNLYNDPAVTQQFGYQGPSLEHGGYLNRGFDDLSWLPTPDTAP
jgi:hypothetical protein